MRLFSQATIADFNELDGILANGKRYVFRDRELPNGCEPKRANIGFQKEGNIYKLSIDSNISANSTNSDFVNWIQKGETKFVGLDDLIAFIRSVGALFDDADHGQKQVNRESGDIASDDSIIDRQKVRELSKSQEKKPEIQPKQISQKLKDQIYGQDDAIDALAEGIAFNMLKKEDKVYVALLLGPPASGKTETGSMLARVLSELSGREYGFIKIDANIYESEHMIHNILGAPPGYAGYGKATVLDPIRKNPYHVVLIDEVEKAHESLLVALMEALETGRLSMADNSQSIDLNKCIVLFTSNIGIDMSTYRSMSEFQKRELCKDAFTKHCGRPEISRRIKDFMVFCPLSEDAQMSVIIKFAQKALDDYEAELVHMDENLMADFMRNKTKYGASELASRVDRAINRAIFTANYRTLIYGKRISLKGTPENVELLIVE